MYIGTFSSGGYFAHQISVEGLSSKFSAWFSPEGDLLDVERIDRIWRSYPVNPTSHAWKDIARRGKFWRALV